MTSYTTWVGQVGNRYVDDSILEIGAAEGGDELWRRSRKAVHQSHVMRSKAPENVLFSPNLAQAQSIRVNITQLPQLSIAHQLN